MHRTSTIARWMVAAVGLALATGVAAQAKDVYRYTDADGHTVYTDRPPPANAKNAQTKRVGGNFIETEQATLAEQQASQRFPVTLYTFACGEVCDSAVGLLNRRGVPFATVDAQTPEGAKRVQLLAGEMVAPVLTVGDKMVGKGFNEARWQQMLDEAGYPKTPARRTAQVGRAPGEAPPPPPPSTETRKADLPDGGYPKQ